MPAVMRWLLVALAAQLLLDVGMLVLGDPSSSTFALVAELGALVVDAAVLLMLARATELTRALIRSAAGVGMAIDAWILLGSITFVPRDAEGLVMIATSVALVVASAFAWVVLGREDVRAWVFTRWLERQGLASPAGHGSPG